MKNIDIKIKIVVGVKEDGTDDVREVRIHEAIAFLKNQLAELERLEHTKKEIDKADMAEQMREIMDAIERNKSTQPYRDTYPTNPWNNGHVWISDNTRLGSPPTSTVIPYDGSSVTYTNGTLQYN